MLICWYRGRWGRGYSLGACFVRFAIITAVSPRLIIPRVCRVFVIGLLPYSLSDRVLFVAFWCPIDKIQQVMFFNEKANYNTTD